MATIESVDDLDPHNQWTRRHVLKYGSSLALASSLLAPNPADAGVGISGQVSHIEALSDGNVDALLDLPPLPYDCCRIFFCRHGQTENNRLRLVQGARVNAPLNDTGRKQGFRMGLALANADPAPNSLVFCSPLKRARQTAEEAIASGYPGRRDIRLQDMDSIVEVDFGPVAEGQKVDYAKPGMGATYARWSMGNVDYRPEGGGDSGRDVLYRAVDAVKTLAAAAASRQCPNRCVAAFTHSVYLRMLLTIFLGQSLAEGATLTIANGSINVLDVEVTGKKQLLGSKSRLVGGFLSRAPGDFRLEIPKARVVRINEIRHLEGV